MTRVENSVEINASPEKVWQYIWELNNLPSYLPIADIKILDSADNFIKLSHKFTAAGRTMDLVCEVEATEINRKMVYKTTKGMVLQGNWILDPVGEGTRVTNILEYTPPGWIFGVILDKLQIKKEMTRISKEGLQKLKEILESPAA